MRILMLAQFYPPIIGGEERHVRSLSLALAAVGHEVVVATLRQENTEEFEIDHGVRIYRIGGTVQRLEGLFSESERRFAPPFPDPETVWALRQIIKKEQPDVIHAHNWLVHSVLPLKFLSKAPLFMTLHDYSLVCAKKRLMYHEVVCTGPSLGKCLHCSTEHYGKLKGPVTYIANRVMSEVEHRAVSMFMPVSQAVAIGTQLTESGRPYQVVPNFIPDDLGQAKATEQDAEFLAQLPQGDFMLFVGDLSRDKGIEVLLEAYSQMKTEVPLVLIGRPMPETPKALPKNVIILQSWPHSAVIQAWKRCLFGVAPSIWPDPCPTVVMEAMAAGRPVIGGKIGGLIDLIDDGKSGFLTTPCDSVALATAMKQLLEDTQLRQNMGRAALEKVREFRAGSVVPRIEKIYLAGIKNSDFLYTTVS